MCIRDRLHDPRSRRFVRDQHVPLQEPAFRFAEGLRSRDPCLLYTSFAADERSSVNLGCRRIIKKNSIVN